MTIQELRYLARAIIFSDTNCESPGYAIKAEKNLWEKSSDLFLPTNLLKPIPNPVASCVDYATGSGRVK